MTMVANNYLNENHPHTEVVELLVLGFTGKLLSWQNHYLTEELKEEIKSAIQKDEDERPIFDEAIGRGVPDGVNTLIYTITRHFIETPSNSTTRIHDQLSNLRCLPLVITGGMRVSLPPESCIKVIVTLPFGRRSSSMVYRVFLHIRLEKLLATPQASQIMMT